MNGDHSRAATARLDLALSKRDTAAQGLDDARGSSSEFHADVQLRAAADEVAARQAWLAWSDGADDAG